MKMKTCPFCGRHPTVLLSGHAGCVSCSTAWMQPELWNHRAGLAPDTDTVKYGSQRNPKVDRRDPYGMFAPGEHLCQCYKCKDYFLGDKRSVMCADCAYGTHHVPSEDASAERQALADAKAEYAKLHELAVRLAKSLEDYTATFTRGSDVCGERILADAKKVGLL